MKTDTAICAFLVCVAMTNLATSSSMIWSGNITGLGQVNSDGLAYSGLLWIPRLAGTIHPSSKLDFALSASVLAHRQGHQDFYSGWKMTGEPYRAWIRWSDSLSEIRFGLQRLAFGPARMLRAQQWFDQLQPQDPLRFTQGVWALRYSRYSLSNRVLQLWLVQGENELRGNDILKSTDGKLETGGRFESPLLTGEMGISFHRREIEHFREKEQELRLGLDGFWDLGPGLWFELTSRYTDLNNSRIHWISTLMVGGDYTVPWGNGVTITLEHLENRLGPKLSVSEEIQNVSALGWSTALNFMDQLAGYSYYTWDTDLDLHSLFWQRTLDHWQIQIGILGSLKGGKWRQQQYGETVRIEMDGQLTIIYRY